jgi:hypothetical protein
LFRGVKHQKPLHQFCSQIKCIKLVQLY